ncbi:MAG: AmmeMemoRadiSam system protein B [Candidatus Neomarinimicrobiota bacterium]
MKPVRLPVARNFYSGNCRMQMDDFLTGFRKPAAIPDRPLAAVVPHAGWLYSGRTAARTLACLAGRVKPQTAIVLGADHSGVYRHTVYPEGAWQTPLGELAVDSDLALLICDNLPELLLADPDVHAGEHSIEVLTPMLKYFWPELKFVPITVKVAADSLDLGQRIGDLVNQRDDIIVLASSDLTHYGRGYDLAPAGSGAAGLEWLIANDRRMIDTICGGAAASVLPEARRQRNACGAGAITTLMGLADRFGRDKGYLIEHTTSHGDRPPERFDYGVGYAGIIF